MTTTTVPDTYLELEKDAQDLLFRSARTANAFTVARDLGAVGAAAGDHEEVAVRLRDHRRPDAGVARRNGDESAGAEAAV